MPWIDTTTEWLDHPASHLIYNGLDTMVTLEVHEALKEIEPEPLAYNFSRALQGPVLAMQLRGFAVDDTQRRSYIALLRKEVIRLREQLNRQTFAVWDKPINPNSTKQLQDLFYGHMGIPEIWVSEKGQRKLSMKREVLEKIEAYIYARNIAAHVIAVRDREKQIQTLETEVDPDGRMRTSYNIAGTETGRFSSSSSAFGTGGNLQNIAPRLRRMFVADPGYVLCTIDLEQAESREVGWLCGTLFGDWTYLDACEGGDLHTLTCKLIWPTLPWPGDRKGDRAIADRTFYREYSYRDMSKRGGHGSNYFGKPFTMARHLKVPTPLMTSFQERYFGAFPAIPRWHRAVAEQLQTTQTITNAFGISRTFFSRPNDDTTLRAAIAHGPQSSTAYRTNLALYRIWSQLPVEVLAQTHDSVTFQIPASHRPEEIIPEALRLMEVTVTDPASGRSCVVPGEAKVGWNWGNYSEELNPDGLRKWSGTMGGRQRRLGLDRVYE